MRLDGYSHRNPLKERVLKLAEKLQDKGFSKIEAISTIKKLILPVRLSKVSISRMINSKNLFKEGE